MTVTLSNSTKVTRTYDLIGVIKNNNVIFALPGDSGAPVYTIMSNNKAALVGIVYGGNNEVYGLNGETYFVPCTEIESKLGVIPLMR
ncbi:hypothetical protein [Methanolapillus ohkumae]|uniref:Uncharacterized protein n=1 Tax=Methanolapillus ohkumae TaxID=3028298 RepID=A0AA96V6X8_9EURY|nr:hypothetical protein MsAm2_00730 [Methanosarcinaceae archaeon Am2]